MKKTSFTSSDYSCWFYPGLTRINSPMKFLQMLAFVVLGAFGAMAQGPNCTHINASIGADDTARVAIGELVTNGAELALAGNFFTVEILGSYNQRIWYQEGLTDTDVLSLYACQYLGRQLKVNVSITGGTGSTCWSYLTFKQGNGPTIAGRSKTVYCFDPLVHGGHIHDVPPQALVPCRGAEDAEFVADWITAFNCDPAEMGMEGNDTAKIILREYEAFDKEGVRGSGYDTIVVLRLPQITEDNAFCVERDTVYCGVGGKIGPYMVAGNTFQYDGMSDIDRYQAISFVETSFNTQTRQLEFKAAEFDPKCGISVHVDAWPLGQGDCSQQYKVNVEIKQTCYGTEGLYGGPNSSDIADFVDTYHPKHWEYTRSNSDGEIEAEGTNVSMGGLDVFDGVIDRPNPELKMVDDAGATSFRLYNGDAEDASTYARMCVRVPTEGTLDFTIAGIDGVGDGMAGYRLNGGDLIELVNGSYSFDLELCDQICFEDRGENITVSALNWVETVVAAPLDMISDGYWQCEFWVIDLDTLPPVLECDLYAKADSNLVHEDTLYIPAGSHECAAHAYLPPAHAIDDWSGIKMVKAIVPGIATVVFEESATIPHLYESHKQVKIPHGLPVPIYYEAYDSCHNIAYDTCWVKVKDLTKPVAICDKGVTVGLSSKKVWVEASTFDEGSWDNCDVNMLLARRVDWWDACVDLCDTNYHAMCYDEHDTIWRTDLEQDKHVDEVEAHYYKTMQWLKEDGRECSDLLWNAWIYDLAKKRTLDCIEHPYEVDDHYFKKLLYDLYCYDEFEGEITQANIDEWDQIGGGWSDAVPFDCEDACSEVMVELLVVDYWCNWSKCWTWVKVEDKTPIDIHRDVEDRIDITCTTYKTDSIYYPGLSHPVSIAYLVELAQAGDSEAKSQLDQLFGGYEKVWRDSYGNVPSPTIGGYDDMLCECDTYTKQEKVWDEHLGYIWKTIEYDSCYYYKEDYSPLFGQVVVNCSQAIQCEQKVWSELDHCGQGYIYREWKFIPGCPPGSDEEYGHIQDTISRTQLIWVGSNCELQKGMFSKPGDVYVNTCGVQYDDAGNATGVLSPEYTGAPEYLFDDDCRIVGVGYQDKVFKIVGGDEACYKIIRTWYQMDWCYLGGKPETSYNWWIDPYYAGKTISWEQKIIVVDTVAPVCTFVEELETVEAAGCAYTLNQTVLVDDSCGALSYYYELLQIKGDEIYTIGYGEGDLDGTSTSFDIVEEDLLTGSYKLKVRVTDECQNESYCIDEFNVITGKKPKAICITSLTAELTPMDLDSDGEIDTAMVTIWANEFDQSSAPACNSDDSIYFRIELMNGASDTSFAGDADSLTLGCEHVGTQQIRLWVIDENGSFDYCDVLLVVQNNMTGCPDGGSMEGQGILAGNIANENGVMIEQVEVKVSGNNVSASLSTDQAGAYNFAVPMGTLVDLVPSKDINDANGVSTMDLITLQKHITGVQKLESPYKMIAADINKDGFVNSLDLLDMRQLILGEVSEFAKNTSWRFVTKDYEFSSSDPQAESFPERFSVSMDQPAMKQDFVGIKIGDLDVDSDIAKRARRSGAEEIMVIADREVNKGDILEIPVSIRDAADLVALQYTLNFDLKSLRIRNFRYNAEIGVRGFHFGTAGVEHGILTVAYDAPRILTGQNLHFVTLEIEVQTNGRLSDMISMSGTVTPAIAVSASGSVSSVSLDFMDRDESNFVRLYQNEPNPVSDETVVRFHLPNRMNATLVFYDVTGKKLKEIEGQYTKGIHSIAIGAEELGSKGVIYYELVTEGDKVARKMIVH